MNKNLHELISWFPSGTAEGEKAILERVFVYVDEFSNVMAPPVGNPHLLVGSKGSGKSAIIDFALRVLKQQSVPATLITPYDIDSSRIGESNSTGDMVRVFYSVLMSSIATKLSEESTGWFDGDRAVLYREAIATGERSPDFIGRMGKFLGDVAKPIIKVDFNSAFPHLSKVTRSELEKAIERSLDSKGFYVFIDDTDQIASPEKPGHLNRIWALLLAVRRLSSNIPEVKAVVSLRSEVWERLQVDPAGQRDQTDHFKSLCVLMKSSKDHVEKIVERRLALAAANLGSDGNAGAPFLDGRGQEHYSPFFEGVGARAPHSEDFRSWRDLILVRSRQRPRDAIQLVNLLAKRAESKKKGRIDEEVFQAVMPGFSETIANLFGQEVVLECPAAVEILKTFADVEYKNGGFTMSSEEVLDHFRKIISKFSVILYGCSLNQQKDSDIFEIWRFFYISGVLNARVSDIREKNGYRHLDPEQDQTLVSKVRWNDLQATLWEVNTVYRDFLINVEKANSTRIGLAVKRSTRRNASRGRRRGS
ncbi:hypothetical protein [Azospirillum sp. SYSU D00513]|uniref:P-loop ATPase, Sll1717 family n=1 Tax=Azospirillum sp. SYSU D00513 TaxID=2812561 RepID=UPI001A957973|nr:hypothetical protein [Azospirillum sp. SYSU D00513]